VDFQLSDNRALQFAIDLGSHEAGCICGIYVPRDYTVMGESGIADSNASKFASSGLACWRQGVMDQGS
jgi:hypothetical protein